MAAQSLKETSLLLPTADWAIDGKGKPSTQLKGERVEENRAERTLF